MILRSAVHSLLNYVRINPKSKLAEKAITLYLDADNIAHASPHSFSLRYLALPSNLLALSQYNICQDKNCFKYKDIMGDSPVILQYLDRIGDLEKVNFDFTSAESIGSLLRDTEKILIKLQEDPNSLSYLPVCKLRDYEEKFRFVASKHANNLAFGFYANKTYQLMAQYVAINESLIYQELTSAMGGSIYNLTGDFTSYTIESLEDLAFLKNNITKLNLPLPDGIESYILEKPVTTLQNYKEQWHMQIVEKINALQDSIPFAIIQLTNSENTYLISKDDYKASVSLAWGALDNSIKQSDLNLNEDRYSEILHLDEVKSKYLKYRYGVFALQVESLREDELKIADQLLAESATLNLNRAWEIAKTI